jgi:thiol-disulfide isomerase/thioredoxin
MNLIRTLWLFCFLLSFNSVATSAQDLSKPGAPAPALQVTKWLQAPAGFDGQWSRLQGKVVVLEFWATWCSPCVHAIPHLNQLANEFHGQGVVFLAVTDDDEDRLKPFLAHQSMDAAIGIDTERKNWKAFGVPSIPHTIVIDKDGNLIGATLPENVTPDILREALAGRKPVLPPKEGVESDLEWDDHLIDWQDGVRPTTYAIIKPIKTTTAGYSPRPAHFTGDGIGLDVLVWAAYETDHLHVDWRMPRDDQTYRVAIRVPEDRESTLLPYLRQTLSTV